MSIFTLSTISLATILFLKDSLNLFFYLKIWMGYPSTEEVKPFDCYFCLIMWTFIIVAIVSLNWLLIPVGFVIAKTIDKLFS